MIPYRLIPDKLIEAVLDLCVKHGIDPKSNAYRIGAKLAAQFEVKSKSPERTKVLQLYSEGLSIKEIAKKTARGIAVVEYHLKKEGLIQAKTRNYIKEERRVRNQKIWRSVRSGKPILEISETFDLKPKTILIIFSQEEQRRDPNIQRKLQERNRNRRRRIKRIINQDVNDEPFLPRYYGGYSITDEIRRAYIEAKEETLKEINEES